MEISFGLKRAQTPLQKKGGGMGTRPPRKTPFLGVFGGFGQNDQKGAEIGENSQKRENLQNAVYLTIQSV